MDSLIDIDILSNIMKTNYHKLVDAFNKIAKDDIIFTEMKDILNQTISKVIMSGEYNTTNTKGMVSDIMNITYVAILLKLDEISIDELGESVLGKKKYEQIKQESMVNSEEILLFDNDSDTTQTEATKKRNTKKWGKNDWVIPNRLLK